MSIKLIFKQKVNRESVHQSRLGQRKAPDHRQPTASIPQICKHLELKEKGRNQNLLGV